MRVALVCPGSASVPSGNGATLRRLARGLRSRGLEVTEIHLGDRGAPPPCVPPDLEGHDVIHALHARKAGGAVRAAASDDW